MPEEIQKPVPEKFGIDGLTKQVQQLAHDMAAVLNHLAHLRTIVHGLERVVKAIPTREEFDAAKAALGQAISDAATRITTDLQALRDQIAAGNPVTDQDLADIQSDTTALGALDPAVVPPPGAKPAARR